MPPKPTEGRTRRSSSRKPSDADTDKSALFNLPDPNWLMDNRSNPARHEERSDHSKKIAAARKNMFQPAVPDSKFETSQGSIPGTFPIPTTEGQLTTQTEESVTATGPATTPPTRPIQLLTYPPMGSVFEGPHANLNPVQVEREIHEIASERHPIINKAPSPIRTTESVRTTSSDARRKSEEIRQLREEMEKLQKKNTNLEDEIATIRSRRSSRMPSPAGSRTGFPITNSKTGPAGQCKD
jgi:hypothetical protein